jgi:hypothetical protein
VDRPVAIVRSGRRQERPSEGTVEPRSSTRPTFARQWTSVARASDTLAPVRSAGFCLDFADTSKWPILGLEACHVVVLELNPHEVASARRLGFTAFLGDGQHEDILLHAGIRDARAVVVTVPSPAAAIDIVRLVRIIAPESVIVARSRYNRYCSELGYAGAHVVHDEETHLGIRMSTSVLEMLCVPKAGDEANLLEPLENDAE